MNMHDQFVNLSHGYYKIDSFLQYYNYLKFNAVCGAYASGSQFKMRVKSFKLGNDVDLIPVVKGNGIGFYNRVDGFLFLEEQECLTAGPRV